MINDWLYADLDELIDMDCSEEAEKGGEDR